MFGPLDIASAEWQGIAHDVHSLTSSQLHQAQGLDDWQSVATVMKEVLKALEYMHDRGRVHRDVKVRLRLGCGDTR